MEKLISKPLLTRGRISHRRFFPKNNHFNYNSTYIFVPLSKIKDLQNTLFSLNKFNLFGFCHSDYGNGNSKNINDWILQILQENNIHNIKNIVLVTHPRVLGYVFNPVSFWLCFDHQNQLIAVLSEVNNTCGQKHNYLCYMEGLEPIKSNDWIEAKKEFYVSPFMKIEGKYKFRFELKNQEMNFFINYLVDNKLKLSTSLKCQFQEFSNKNLLISFIKTPFFTLKTMILIHYQAIKLYLKSIRYYKCPEALKNNLTIGKGEKQNF